MKATYHIIIPAIAAAALFVFASCTNDPAFNFNSDTVIDTEMTFFEKGIEVPLYKSEKISIEELMSSTDSSLAKLLDVDKDGNYIYTDSGEATLDYTFKVKEATRADAGAQEFLLDKTISIGIDINDGGNSSLDICLDANPELKVNLGSNLCFPAEGAFTITPWRNGKPVEENIVAITGVKLPYSADGTNVEPAKLYIAKNASSKCPEGYQAIDADICKTFNTLPDSLVLSTTVLVNEDDMEKYSPDERFKFTVDYELAAPLTFGKDFHADYKTEIDITEDILDLIGGASFRLFGSLKNATPLSLYAKLTLLGADGDVIPMNGEAVIDIAASDAVGKETVSELDLDLGLKNETDKDKLSKMRLAIELKASPDVPINEASYIQMNLSLALPDGITTDFSAL